MFNTDGKRISSIFDISKVNKVLIAGKEKYNLTPLQGSSLPKPEYDVPEEKGVISVIKHA